MKCEICHRSPPAYNVALYRVNELGVDAVMRCTEHLTDEQFQSVFGEPKPAQEYHAQELL